MRTIELSSLLHNCPSTCLSVCRPADEFIACFVSGIVARIRRFQVARGIGESESANSDEFSTSPMPRSCNLNLYRFALPIRSAVLSLRLLIAVYMRTCMMSFILKKKREEISRYNESQKTVIEILSYRRFFRWQSSSDCRSSSTSRQPHRRTQNICG